MKSNALIALFTDFGFEGPYIGQTKAAIYQTARVTIVDLLADAPRFDPVASSYLLAAYTKYFPLGTTFLCVVDPGVGTNRRRAVVVKAGGCYFVGPDNGLFDVIKCVRRDVEVSEITWAPPVLSNTFHGRDLFAPVAAHLAAGSLNLDWLGEWRKLSTLFVEPDHYCVIYIDGFGNAVCGVRGKTVEDKHMLLVKGHRIEKGHTFSDVAVGKPMWYENSSGLVEISVNQGSAVDVLNLNIGVGIEFN